MRQEIEKKYKSYPEEVRIKLEELREIIFCVARENGLGEVAEDVKWGEASYSCKNGSPIRIDWKKNYPDQVSMFVSCNTILIETYREVFGSTLNCVGKREVAFPLSQPLPKTEIKACVYMALHYHKLKHLPLLGA